MLNLALHQHIFVNAAISHTHQPCDNPIGHADILDKVLPALSAQKMHRLRTLEQVDDYMLLETKRLLEKLQRCFKQMLIPNGMECQLVLENEGLVLTTESSKLQALTQLVNRDNWLFDAFSWLQPNFIGLVHSFEWLDFSFIYAKNQTTAVTTFKHFEHSDHGLRCTLRYHRGLLQMFWQSPYQSFYLNTDR